MERIIESVLDSYLHAYRNLIAVEPVDANSVTLSFPFHLAAGHRVELTVTDLGNDQCVISDAARTIGEIEDAGYQVKHIKQRLETIARTSGLRLVKDYLLLESTYTNLGISIQTFLEASKTIGDVYLVHKRRIPAGETKLLSEVKAVLDSRLLLYRESDRIRGEIEYHPFDLVIPSNGRPGLVVTVLKGQDTHSLAQIWGFRCDDIRRETTNDSIRLALIYDVRFATWSETSKKILESRANIAIPGDSLADLPPQLEQQGIIDRV